MHDEIVAALDDDGATYKLDDERTLRLRIEPDPFMSVMDDTDFYGSLAFADVGHRNDYGRRERPDGFNGNAERLSATHSYDAMWWQPPPDVKRGTETFHKVRSALLELLECGYSIVTVELLHGTDGYGRPIVERVASLGGVEPFQYGDGTLAEILSDLLLEVLP